MGRIIPNEETSILFALVAPGEIAPPVNAAFATATTGGSLAAGDYTYRVVALTESGHTLPSAETSETVPAGSADNTVTVNWAAVVGETSGYDIYGRTVGAELKIGHVATGVHTFVDDGSVTPIGALPAESTALNLGSPSVSDVNNALDLTHEVMSLNASATGNVVPTPALDTLFETSIIGTSQATFTGDFYRDDEDDIAWNALPRGTKGWFIIARFGGKPNEVGDLCEVWPVSVVSRSMANMTNNTVESFTVTCSVNQEPAESAVVVA